MNVGRLSYTKENGGNFGLNVRYPVTTNFEEMIAKLKEYVGTHGFAVADYSNSRPHHVDKASRINSYVAACIRRANR